MKEHLLEALVSAAEGETIPETAERLSLSQQAVAKRRHNLCVLLGARNITHAVALAYQRGVLKQRGPG